MTDYAVVGGGPVALWTAIQTKIRNPKCNITVYEKALEYERKHVLVADEVFFEGDLAHDDLYYAFDTITHKMSIQDTPFAETANTITGQGVVGFLQKDWPSRAPLPGGLPFLTKGTVPTNEIEETLQSLAKALGVTVKQSVVHLETEESRHWAKGTATKRNTAAIQQTIRAILKSYDEKQTSELANEFRMLINTTYGDHPPARVDLIAKAEEFLTAHKALMPAQLTTISLDTIVKCNDVIICADGANSSTRKYLLDRSDEPYRFNDEFLRMAEAKFQISTTYEQAAPAVPAAAQGSSSKWALLRGAKALSALTVSGLQNCSTNFFTLKVLGVPVEGVTPCSLQISIDEQTHLALNQNFPTEAGVRTPGTSSNPFKTFLDLKLYAERYQTLAKETSDLSLRQQYVDRAVGLLKLYQTVDSWLTPYRNAGDKLSNLTISVPSTPLATCAVNETFKELDQEKIVVAVGDAAQTAPMFESLKRGAANATDMASALALKSHGERLEALSSYQPRFAARADTLRGRMGSINTYGGMVTKIFDKTTDALVGSCVKAMQLASIGQVTDAQEVPPTTDESIPLSLLTPDLQAETQPVTLDMIYPRIGLLTAFGLSPVAGIALHNVGRLAPPTSVQTPNPSLTMAD